MSEKKKRKRGRPSTVNKKVRVKNTDEVYDNYREAAIATNSNRGDVYLCLMHHRQRHNGYEFEFVIDDVDEEEDE